MENWKMLKWKISKHLNSAGRYAISKTMCVIANGYSGNNTPCSKIATISTISETAGYL
jgi:hypothetical protein